MKLKDDFLTHYSDKEQVMVDTSGKFSGIVRSNPTAGFIVDCLKSDTTECEIIEKMVAKYDAPVEVITEDVQKILNTLKGIGAIDE
ncbi:MAG: PqqD family protein [Acutalibacteraceae bacterium]|nr:PqqD family protein [Acutalibacteraceae bacterium]